MRLSRRPSSGARTCHWGRRGGTLAQLLVVVGIVALLLGIVLPVAARLRASARSVHCLSNLRGVGTAFRLYAADNGGRLPDPASTETPWERSLGKYVDAAVFACPGDQELAPATGSSYDWRDTGREPTTLAGQALGHARGDAVLAFDALPGWHAAGRMNAVRADGSGGSPTSAECVADLSRPASAP